MAIVGVGDANDRAAVVAALEAVEPGWALSYTGGTKVMAAHARLAYERLGDGRAAHASVVDGCVRFDDGRTLALADGEVTFRALALLHGHKLVGGTAPRVSPADLGRVRHLLGPRLKAVAAGRATLDGNDPQLAGIPRAARRLLTTAARPSPNTLPRIYAQEIEHGQVDVAASLAERSNG